MFLQPAVVALLGKGLALTIALTVITSVLATCLGVLVGLGRLQGRRWLSVPAAVFVETFRNIPALVLVVFFAFALPNAFAPPLRRALFFDNPITHALAALTGLLAPWYLLGGALGLTLNTAAYIAELFRAGVGTVAREHVDAARSMGASWGVVYRKLLIPGGLHAAHPAITSRLIHNMKNTALLSFVSVPDFYGAVLTAISRSFQAIEFLLLAAAVYLVLSLGMSAGLQAAARKLFPTPRRPA
ncbi:MAG: ABC transporter permease subunit [Chloroflexi bacterium]|nr:MAG: ABC transporter permease subunit [Chloroflexota bacterium]